MDMATLNAVNHVCVPSHPFKIHGQWEKILMKRTDYIYIYLRFKANSNQTHASNNLILFMLL